MQYASLINCKIADKCYSPRLLLAVILNAFLQQDAGRNSKPPSKRFLTRLFTSHLNKKVAHKNRKSKKGAEPPAGVTIYRVPLRGMIGFEYKGQVSYITRIDDFHDYMEPEVYEAVRKAFENGCDGGLQQEYKELQEKYENLQSDYDELEDVTRNIDDVREELEECEEERDAIQEKYDTLTHCIKVLINEYYQRYIKLEDVISKLEKMI